MIAVFYNYVGENYLRRKMLAEGHAVLRTIYIMFYISSYFNTQANVKPAERISLWQGIQAFVLLVYEASSVMENKSHGMLEFRTWRLSSNILLRFQQLFFFFQFWSLGARFCFHVALVTHCSCQVPPLGSDSASWVAEVSIMPRKGQVSITERKGPQPRKWIPFSKVQMT